MTQLSRSVFVNCARALSTHLPFLGASVTQSFKLGPSLSRRRPHFCRNRRACQSAFAQQDSPHRATGDALDAGQQLRPARTAAAAAVPHAVEDVSDQHVAVYQVYFGNQLLFATAVSHDAEEPRRKRAQRLVQGLLAGGQRVVAVAAPAAHGDACPGHPGPCFARCHGRIAALPQLQGRILFLLRFPWHYLHSIAPEEIARAAPAGLC